MKYLTRPFHSPEALMRLNHQLAGLLLLLLAPTLILCLPAQPPGTSYPAASLMLTEATLALLCLTAQAA